MDPHAWTNRARPAKTQAMKDHVDIVKSFAGDVSTDTVTMLGANPGRVTDIYGQLGGTIYAAEIDLDIYEQQRIMLKQRNASHLLDHRLTDVTSLAIEQASLGKETFFDFDWFNSIKAWRPYISCLSKIAKVYQGKYLYIGSTNSLRPNSLAQVVEWTKYYLIQPILQHGWRLEQQRITQYCDTSTMVSSVSVFTKKQGERYVLEPSTVISMINKLDLADQLEYLQEPSVQGIIQDAGYKLNFITSEQYLDTVVAIQVNNRPIKKERKKPGPKLAPSDDEILSYVPFDKPIQLKDWREKVKHLIKGSALSKRITNNYIKNGLIRKCKGYGQYQRIKQ